MIEIGKIYIAGDGTRLKVEKKYSYFWGLIVRYDITTWSYRNMGKKMDGHISETHLKNFLIDNNLL